MQKFLACIKDYAMLEKGDSVLVGLSGGADSVCLLLNLLEIAEDYQLKVSAIHLNHQLRGAESDKDEKFCVDLCKRLDVPLTTKKLDVLGVVEKTGKSVEESARDLRYEAFDEHACGGKIATAHSLSDNAETVLFNLTRGTGLKGLCGIPPVRDNIIRPLITSTREEIEEYLLKKEQDYVIDKTNLSTDYTRNKIRLEIIPNLKNINPNLLASIGKTIQLLTIENNYLETDTKKVYNRCKIGEKALDLALLRAEHTAIRRRCIAIFLKENCLEQSFDRILAIDEILYGGGKINLTKHVYIMAKMGILSIVRDVPVIPDISLPMVLGHNSFLGKKITISIINHDELDKIENVNKKFAISYLDYDKIQGKVVLRNRRIGDKIQLLNRNFESTVKKLFNAKIPQEERSHHVFFVDEAGVIFIEDIGISDRIKIDDNTKNILKIVIDRSVKN